MRFKQCICVLGNKDCQIWYFFLLIIALEFFLFKSYALKNITPFYPAGYDQTGYLNLSYNLYNNIKQQGLISGLIHSDILVTGVLFPIQAVFFFLLLEPSRLNALLPNFFYFIALQGFSLLALRSISSKNYLSAIFLGLLLSLATPFWDTGGIMDFRMDFIAFCLYGLFISLAVKSNFFLNRQWSFLAGLVAGLCILSRCLTVTYLSITISVFLLYLACSLLLQKRESLAYSNKKAQFINLSLASFISTLITLPYLWLSRIAIYNYYFGNHFISSEKYIRASEVGVASPLSDLFFYPASLLLTHLGYLSLIITCLTLLIFSYLYFTSSPQLLYKKYDLWSSGFIFLSLSILAPLVTLTADKSKSPIVGSIMVMPFLWLVIWCYLALNEKFSLSKNSTHVINISAGLILIAGLFHQVHELHHFPSKTKLRDGATIVTMYEDIANYALAKQWPSIELSVDQITDYLISPGIAAVYYEKHHIYLHCSMQRLGNSMFAIDKTDVINSLKNSNVVILNLNAYPGHSVFPFNQRIRFLKPFIYNLTEKQFIRLKDYHFMGSTYRVYVHS